MNLYPMAWMAALSGAAALVCTPALAQPAAATPVAARAPAGTAEPKVQRTVIEDDGARIEELRVRGHTQSIVVAPKRGGAAPYEIITGDGSRDLGEGANTSRGAAGKRVWNVLKF